MRPSSSFTWNVLVLIITMLAATGSSWQTYAAANQSISNSKDPLNQIESRINIAERQFSDIRPGLEKSIIWAGAPHRRTDYAIVYVHGFSASKEELRPVPDLIAASLGANIFYTRLTGHGRTTDAMREASVKAWMQDLAEAYEIGTIIGEKVIILSCSTGGTLVANGLASGVFSEKLFSVVFFAPNFGLQDRKATLLTWPLARYWAPSISGEIQTSTRRNDLHSRYWTTSYPTISLIPMMQLIDRVNGNSDEGTTVPALFYFSPDDKVVDPQKTENFIARWRGPKSIKRINGGDSEDELNHLITGQVVSPSQVIRAADTVIRWHRLINQKSAQ